MSEQQPSPVAGDEASEAAEIAAEKDASRGLRPGQKSKNFWPSTTRLVREMGPERIYVAIAIVLGAISVALSTVGPRILGHATDIIFTGLISKNMPADATADQVVEGMRARGEDEFADMVAAMPITPGQGIDFDALHRTLLLVIGLYVAAALLLSLIHI